MADAPEGFTNARNTGVDLLLADVDLALTFMEVAAVSGMVLRLLDTVRLDAPQRPAISQKLALLKERLEKVGYRF